jgi:hypothetical protein
LHACPLALGPGRRQQARFADASRTLHHDKLALPLASGNDRPAERLQLALTLQKLKIRH